MNTYWSDNNFTNFTSVNSSLAPILPIGRHRLTKLMGFGNCSRMDDFMLKWNDPLWREPNLRQLIITVYAVVSVFGTLGNMLVILAVVRNPQMRTPRNMFIINLSATDLAMSLITVPFSLKYILFSIWDLGEIMCKIVSMMQAVNIFVSTMSITAIGLDRYWVILFPTKIRYQNICLAASFFAVWSVSITMALPMFFTAHLQSLDEMLPRLLRSLAKPCGYTKLVGCFEGDPNLGLNFRKFYSVGCFAFQYALPILTLAFVYGRIICSLRSRAHLRIVTDTARRRDAAQRQSRVNVLLICVIVTFAICWLPLNTYIILLTFDVLKLTVPTFAFCHASGVLSACVNPILYGILNENFRREFKEIIGQLGIGSLLTKVHSACVKRSESVGIGEKKVAKRNTTGDTFLSLNGRQEEVLKLGEFVPKPPDSHMVDDNFHLLTTTDQSESKSHTNEWRSAIDDNSFDVLL